MKFNIPYNEKSLFAEVHFFEEDELRIKQVAWIDEKGSIILSEYDYRDGEIRMMRYKNKEQWAKNELREDYEILRSTELAKRTIAKSIS